MKDGLFASSFLNFCECSIIISVWVSNENTKCCVKIMTPVPSRAVRFMFVTLSHSEWGHGFPCDYVNSCLVTRE